MRSVADALRDDTRRTIEALTPEARMRLALELGDADVAALCDARGLSVEAAKAAMAARHRVGRQPSIANGD